MNRIERLGDLDLEKIQRGDSDELAALLALLHPIISLRVTDAVEDLARGFQDEWDTALEFLDQPSAVHHAVRVIFGNLEPHYFTNERTFYGFIETMTTAAVLGEFRELLLKKYGVDTAPASAGPAAAAPGRNGPAAGTHWRDSKRKTDTPLPTGDVASVAEFLEKRGRE